MVLVMVYDMVVVEISQCGPDTEKCWKDFIYWDKSNVCGFICWTLQHFQFFFRHDMQTLLYTQPSGRQRQLNENYLKLSASAFLLLRAQTKQYSDPQVQTKQYSDLRQPPSPLFYLLYPYFLPQPTLLTIHLLTNADAYNTCCAAYNIEACHSRQVGATMQFRLGLQQRERMIPRGRCFFGTSLPNSCPNSCNTPQNQMIAHFLVHSQLLTNLTQVKINMGIYQLKKCNGWFFFGTGNFSMRQHLQNLLR